MLFGVSCLKNILTLTYGWVGFIFLLLSLSCYIFDVSIYDSSYIPFYGLSILGLISGIFSRIFLKLQTTGLVTKTVGNIGFYGNLIIVILFFPLVYFFWGTLIFGV